MDLEKFKPREYIVADSDSMSIQKIKHFETQLSEINLNYKINKIPRSRRVGQSYLTSILTTLIAIFYSIPLMFNLKADLLIVNGKGCRFYT
jgi:beta-1,4-N-acetylglucosaminyltransferase